MTKTIRHKDELICGLHSKIKCNSKGSYDRECRINCHCDFATCPHMILIPGFTETVDNVNEPVEIKKEVF